jgi:hypothetical protein
MCFLLQLVQVATAQGEQGKQGICKSLFPDRENTGNLASTQGKFSQHREFFEFRRFTTNLVQFGLDISIFKNVSPCFTRH